MELRTASRYVMCRGLDGSSDEVLTTFARTTSVDVDCHSRCRNSRLLVGESTQPLGGFVGTIATIELLQATHT
jgi:hypothetical protein